MANKHSFKVTFSNEAEVFWPTALSSGRITEYFHGSNILITNKTTSPVSIGFGDWTLAEWEGAVLGSSDGTEPGGSILLDLKANNASTGRIRAKVHGGWTGVLSFLIL